MTRDKKWLLNICCKIATSPHKGLMNSVSRSFNISNFISRHSLVLQRIDVLKKLRKVHRKTPLLEYILVKIHVSNLQSETLIKGRDTSAGVFWVRLAISSRS